VGDIKELSVTVDTQKMGGIQPKSYMRATKMVFFCAVVDVSMVHQKGVLFNV
jgi:hypothetical protein